MKKLILMTSALTLIGGAAAAEITIGANASLSYGNWNTGGGDADFDWATELTADFEESAGGVTYGASLSFEVDADGGTDDDLSGDDGIIYISTDYGKLSFGVNEFDELEAETDTAPDTSDPVEDDALGDIKFEYAMGDFSATVVADIDGVGDPATTPADAAEWIVILGYTTGPLTIGLETDSLEFTELALDYDAGSFGVGATVDTDDGWEVRASTTFGGVNAALAFDDGDVATLNLDGTSGDVAWALEVDTDENIEASITYSMDPITVGLAYNDEVTDAPDGLEDGDEADLILTVDYAVTDLLSVNAKLNDADEYEIGVSMGFVF